MKKILVLNMGMKGIRCIIFDSKGNKLASSNVPMRKYAYIIRGVDSDGK